MAERQLERLDRLAEAGMEMIEALTAQAKGSGPKVVEGDVALAFSRVSRAVRMAVLLQNELSQGREDPEAAAREAALQAEAGRRAAHRDRAVRIVRRVARDHCRREPFAVSAIAREAAERLDDDDIYGLVQTRPVGELVAMICRDLGLEPNWDALAGEAWAQAEFEGGAAGSPFLDDETGEDAAADDPPEPDPEPAPRVRLLETPEAALLALARDPEIIAIARRDTG
ncbi:MAG: hypothetical protein ACXWKY_16865 [Caulobacteraceae bacterium]